MAVITTRLTVDAKGSISAAESLPAGEYEAELQAAQPEGAPSNEPIDLSWLPQFDVGPWPEGMTFRREDIYGDDGR